MSAARQSRKDTRRRGIGFGFSFKILALLATAGTVAVTTLVLTRVNERHLESIIRQEAESNLLLEARNLASLSSEALLAEFPELTLVPLVKDLQAGRPDLQQVLVLDHGGRIQGGPEPRRIGQLHSPPADLAPLPERVLMNPGETLSGTGNTLQVTSPVHHPTEGVIGRVVVGIDRSRIQGKIQEARAAMVRSAAILLGAAVLLVTVFVTFLFRPVGVLREGLQRIGAGDLDRPIRVNGPSELMQLAETLNEMAAQLQDSRRLANEREQEILATQTEIIFTLGEVVESRSHETANHTRRVGAMSRELALLAGLPAAQAEMLRMAAPMHDIGKIGIPDSILNKPGKLTLSEYEGMKVHAEIGHKILSNSDRPLMKAAAIIAHQHHERWDGNGYPRGLVREEIHIFGRIVSLVDVFDALHSDRIYRSALPLEEVLEHLREEQGRMFDPELVDLFAANVKRFLSISERLSDAAAIVPRGLSAPAQPAAAPAAVTTEPEPVGVGAP